MGALDDKFDLIAGASDEFIDGLKGIDQQLALEIIKIYSRFVVGNELVLDATELAKLDDSIVAAIKTTDYKELVDKYLPNFDLLGDLNKELHLQENQINIEDLLRENDKINNHLSAVEAQLRGTNAMKVQVTTDGVRRVTNIPNDSLDKLVKPISEMIRQDVLLGVSFESATEQMLEAISAGNLGLEQWAGQIARDALSQHDGIQQQQIKEDFDLQYQRYIGTIKNTTRPICYHLLVKKDEPVYTDDELQAVLNEYVPGGVPSTSKTNNTADGTWQKKGNGIIPGTDLGNFTIRRGGYNCRHQLIPTVLGPDEEETGVEEPTTETPPTFKNKKEVQQYIDQNIRTPIDISRGSMDTLNEIVPTLKQMEDRLGDKIPKGVSITFDYSKIRNKKSYGIYNPDTKKIHLKPNLKKQKEKFIQEFGIKRNGKYIQRSTNASETLIHEMGHAIDHDNNWQMSKNLKGLAFRNDAREEILEWTSVSTYGSDIIGQQYKAREAVAENFLAWYIDDIGHLSRANKFKFEVLMGLK